MHIHFWTRLTIAFAFTIAADRDFAAEGSTQESKLPPPANHAISFSKEIKPIFEASCIKCHGRGRNKGNFQLDTRETVVKGGDSGPAVVSGHSEKSYLIELVAGLNPDNIMPQKGSKLTAEQIGLLRAWIDQGLPWDSGISFARKAPINLYPRQPPLPQLSKSKSKNPVDLFLAGYFRAHQFQPPRPVDDRLFARRVYLDVIGLLPPPDELQQFVADRRSDKRSRLVKRLLSDNQRYAEHWLTFWNDALRNDYKGTGYIDGGRKQITTWLYSALATNMPFDRFVAQLVNPTADSEGFVKGIVWRGVVNASQTPQMQAAQNISQVFMGVNLKCASCHDSFINDWTLADAYGLASIYAKEELKMVQCDHLTGKVAPMRFLYPELGVIDAKAPVEERLKQLAEILTQEKNGRLTRTIVNRLWAKFLGRGLVEPVDEMENPAWNADLLDWLAADLAQHGYDLKRTIEQILTSEAYQLPARPMTERAAKDFVFQGPFVRRLSAEQYLDALAAVTGVWRTLPASYVDFSLASGRTGASADAPARLQWIWKDAGAARKTEPATVYFRRTIRLEEMPTVAHISITCDNSFNLFINGKEAASGKDYGKPALIDVRKHLVKGANIIAVSAVNDPAAPDKKNAEQSNPAGLLLYARVRHEHWTKSVIRHSTKNGRPGSTSVSRNGEPQDRLLVETIMDFASDNSWVWSTEKSDGWLKTEFAQVGWQRASELGEKAMQPWDVGKKFSELVSSASQYGKIRAALVNADPLMVALGRPNREQVMTVRSSVATTLQALEMTNGSTLAEQLKKGAEKIVEDNPLSGRALVALVYERALSRRPTNDELSSAEELVGSTARAEGIEDLLWVVSMLPEFQLIY